MNWLMSMMGRQTNRNMLSKLPGMSMKKASIPMIALGIGAIAYGMKRRKSTF